MHFLLVTVKGFEHIFLEVFEELVFHLVGDFVEEPSDVLVTVEIVEEPSEPFVDSHDVVVKIEESVGEVILELFGQDSNEGGVRLKVV